MCHIFVCLSSIPANQRYHHSPAPDFTWAPIKRTCTSSHPLTRTFISTSTRALPRPVSFRHHWTHSLLLSLVIVYDWFTNLLCHPQRVVFVLSPPLRLSVLHFPSRIPHSGSIHDLLETVGQHRSELLITSRRLIIPLLPCFLLSLIDFNKHLCSTLSQSLWVNP